MYFTLAFPTKGYKMFKCKKRNSGVDVCDVSQSTFQAEADQPNADADPCPELHLQY